MFGQFIGDLSYNKYGQPVCIFFLLYEISNSFHLLKTIIPSLY